MTWSFDKFKKLKGCSFDELYVRGGQALAAYAERYGLSARTRVPGDAEFCRMIKSLPTGRGSACAESLLTHFRKRPAPRFFAAFNDREETAAEWQRRWPHAPQQAVERAGRIGAGRFDLLGMRNLYFGEPVDWHLEPLSGNRSPLLHWSRIGELDAAASGDKKVVWELNRHQHLVTLGQAYWSTQDERYARLFSDHISSWIVQNPPAHGVNWMSNLEVALRVISWLWALYYFKDSPHLTAQLFLQTLKYVYLHGQHLETYLSTYVSPNTHLTGEALGLFYLGTLLPELPPANRWRALGKRVLLRELGRHVKRDGVYFEQTSYYHRYTTDFYTHFYLLSEANNHQVAVELKERLTALLDHLMYITKPDGRTPLFGDDDGGRLLMLGEAAPNDFRAALSTGAAIFARPDYKFVSGGPSEEMLWLLGPAGLRSFDSLDAQPPAHNSRAFVDGGYYVMRDAWTPDANYMMFDGGAHGEPSCGHAHAHADALSFELAAHGRTLLVDPGTYTYTGSKGLRDWFRSSPAHNVLTVDGESSSVPDGPFSWKSIAWAETVAWISQERFDYVEGKHDGYLRLPAPVAHTRSILFLKNDYWIMRDQVTSSAEHLYALWFHLNSDLNGRVDAEQALVISEVSDEARLKIFAFADDGYWGRGEAAVSHCYGEKEQAAVGVFSANAADAEFVTFLLPLAQVRVSEIKAIGGRAFEVISEKAVDLVMIREGQRVETARMASDFKLTWARFSHSGEQLPEELVLIDGQTLELEGQEILKSRTQLSYLAASRKDDSEFRISDCEFRNGDPKAEIEIRNPKFDS